MTAAAGSMVCNIHEAIIQFAVDLIVLTCTARPPVFQVKHSY